MRVFRCNRNSSPMSCTSCSGRDDDCPVCHPMTPMADLPTRAVRGDSTFVFVEGCVVSLKNLRFAHLVLAGKKHADNIDGVSENDTGVELVYMDAAKLFMVGLSIEKFWHAVVGSVGR